MAENQVPAGWYPDPQGDPNSQRYWDGTAWTNNVQGGSPTGGQSQWGTVQQPSYQAQPSGEDKSSMWLVIGIVCIFIAAWPIAIGQIVMAVNAKSAYAAGDYATYTAKLKTAKTLLIVNIVVGVLIWLCCIISILTTGSLAYLYGY